ncbi:MAG TPA: glycosyltransferase family 4 protein [Candidatus Bathyarchaeia archaeon]|nr:glycosyltransferase family 4 protein [Candidatus Bathyarchaeia archaeon]
MKILFVSRAYPPIVGGIENQNFGIGDSLSKLVPTRIVANKSGKKNLPVFLPWIALKSLFMVPKYDAVLVGDGVLAPVALFWKIFFPKKRYFSVVHGLDITFARKKSILGKIYRAVNIPSLRKLDKLIMVGNETIIEAEKIGIPKEKCVFIPNGFFPDEICKECSRNDLEKLLGTDLKDKKVIFRGGRFTKHKGVEWFICNVLPRLPENYILVAAGGGIAKKTAGDENHYPKCENAINDLKMENRVKLMLNLKRSDMKTLFNACDLYISPNIKVSGSMEGFGITAIEAAACARVVLASELEGLKDAIKDGQNGFLVEPGNADAWVKKINELLADDAFRKKFGEKAREYTIENYSWDKIAKRYLEEMKNSNL